MSGRTAVLCCVSLVCALALDSNNISGSREPSSNHTVQAGDDARTTVDAHNSARRPSCSDCDVPQASCPRHTSRDRDPEPARTKAAEMSGCVRSRDCADGLCCARWLTGRRCQRIPAEGEACLLRGSAKIRRKLGRCDCDAGLTCRATGRAAAGRVKGQGVCTPHRHGQRRAGNSGKRKRTAERSC